MRLQWSLTLLLIAAQGRVPTARDVIEAALARLGGEAQLTAQRTWFVAGAGEENLSAELQGLTPGQATVRPHQEWLGVDARRQAVAWERRTPRNDQSLRWRRFLYRDDSTGFIVWTDSVRVMTAGGTPETRRRAMMRRVPHLLLLEASRAGSLQLGGIATLHGRRHQEVRARLAEGTWISLWFSADSNLLGRAEYRTLLPGRGEVVVQWEWPRWERGTGVAQVPTGHRIIIGGETYQRVEYRRFEVATAAADSMLSVPNELGARRRPTAMQHAMPDAREDALPASGEVAPGVHIEEVAGFNVLIVEFADFVLLVEAPAAAPGFEALPATRGADRIAAELSSRVRGIARGRPLGYTVLTHAHSDHLGSAPALDSATGRSWCPLMPLG